MVSAWLSERRNQHVCLWWRAVRRHRHCPEPQISQIQRHSRFGRRPAPTDRSPFPPLPPVRCLGFGCRGPTTDCTDNGGFTTKHMGETSLRPSASASRLPMPLCLRLRRVETCLANPDARPDGKDHPASTKWAGPVSCRDPTWGVLAPDHGSFSASPRFFVPASTSTAPPDDAHRSHRRLAPGRPPH